MKEPTRLYTAFSGIFLLLQGTSTLAFRLFPSLDEAFPALLSVTQMIPPHSILHILTGIVALIVLFRGGQRGTFWFAAGFGIFYLSLGIFGLITRHPTMLGLQPFDQNQPPSGLPSRCNLPQLRNEDPDLTLSLTSNDNRREQKNHDTSTKHRRLEGCR